jgi:hypothetical protein
MDITFILEGGGYVPRRRWPLPVHTALHTRTVHSRRCEIPTSYGRGSEMGNPTSDSEQLTRGVDPRIDHTVAPDHTMTAFKFNTCLLDTKRCQA